MAVSPEAVVRDFLASWEHPSAEQLAGFFTTDAVYIDGSGNERSGSEAIRAEFERQLVLGGDGVQIEVKRTAADGRVVMVERVDRFAVGGQSFALEAVGVYEVDSDGLIEFFRDYYDQSAIVAQLEAAGFHVA